MILDNQLVLSDAQALTATAASTNVLDLKAAGLYGNGEPLALVVWVDVAADGTTGDETYTVKLQSDDADTFGSATDLTAAVSIPRTTAVAGYKVIVDLPANAATERYLRAYYTLAGTTPTVTVTAALMPLAAAGQWKAHPDGFTIS